MLAGRRGEVSTLPQNAALLFASPRARLVPMPELFSESIHIAGW